MIVKKLNLDDICIDAGTQARVEHSQDTIDDYAELMAEGVVFRAVEVMSDGLHNYLTNGFHRYFATKKIGKVSIEAEVTPGTLREAKVKAQQANADHGLPRTRADRRKSALYFLEDMEYCEWSDVKIAKASNVSHTFVQKLRKELGEPARKEVTFTTPKGTKVVRKLAPVVESPVDEKENDKEAMKMLNSEVERLSALVAVNAMDATEEEKTAASSLIDDLRSEVRLLTIEVVALKRSRDAYQAENSQLMKQVAMLQRQLKK